AILEVIVEEWLHDRAAKPGGGVAFEQDRADAASLAPPLTVGPRTQYQVDHAAVRILRRQRPIECRSAVDIFLIEQTADDHHRYGERLLREQLVECLVLPERVVGGMRRQRTPVTKLVQSMQGRHRAGRTRLQIGLVGVTFTAPPLLFALACRLLIVDVVESPVLPEGAVVKPSIACRAIR